MKFVYTTDMIIYKYIFLGVDSFIGTGGERYLRGNVVYV